MITPYEKLYHLIPKTKSDEKVSTFTFIETLSFWSLSTLEPQRNLPVALTWYLGDLLNHQHQGDQDDQVDPGRIQG